MQWKTEKFHFSEETAWAARAQDQGKIPAAPPRVLSPSLRTPSSASPSITYKCTTHHFPLDLLQEFSLHPEFDSKSLADSHSNLARSFLTSLFSFLHIHLLKPPDSKPVVNLTSNKKNCFKPHLLFLVRNYPCQIL